MAARAPIPIVGPHDPLPDARTALPDGLVAIGGGLSVERLVEAYSKGLFPWSSEPVTWWSPDPRAVFDLDKAPRASRRLAQKLRQGRFRVTRDRAFLEVMAACAEPRPDQMSSSWIDRGLMDAYDDLHRAGYAHSVEVWLEGRLVGGVYGVAIGASFAGESMFYRETDASKIALVSLADHLRERGFTLFDAQVANPFTLQMGAEEIPREAFLLQLRRALRHQVRFE